MIIFYMLVVLYILVMNDLSFHVYPSLSMFEIITLVAPSSCSKLSKSLNKLCMFKNP